MVYVTYFVVCAIGPVNDSELVVSSRRGSDGSSWLFKSKDTFWALSIGCIVFTVTVTVSPVPLTTPGGVVVSICGASATTSAFVFCGGNASAGGAGGGWLICTDSM